MIMIAIFVALVAVVFAGKPTNMTDFWQGDFEAFAGYESLDWFFEDAQYFYTYWGVEARNMNDTDVPLIVFLQGGPGDASQFSTFNYIGPFKVIGEGEELHVERNHLGWNGLGNLLTVDQPLGVGFSYDKIGHITRTTEEAALYFSNFLYNFFRTWNLTSDTPVYLTGESYAGHYVPVFAQYLMSNRSLGISVKGISIGGPYIDSYIQDNYFDSLMSSFGLVDESTAGLLQYYQVKSMMNIRKGRFAEATHEMNRISNDEDFFEEYYGGINIFNLRQYDEGNCNYDYDVYLNRIKKNFKVVPDHLQYIDTNDIIYEAFSADLSQSKEVAVLYCLSRIKVMLYVGQNDAVVSSAGLQTYLNSWGWTMRENWKRSSKEFLKLGDRIYGWRKRYSRLTLALVNDAGHFVPADQPIGFYSLFAEWLAQ